MQYGVDTYGVYIIQITPGSGAEKAGLQLGDRVVAVDNNSVNATTDLTGYLQGKNVGDTVSLQIERDGKMANYDVVLGEGATGPTATTDEDAQQNPFGR